MSEGGQVRRSRPKQDEESTAPSEETAESVDTSEVDELLDDIDEVLEENAEEFVKNYVQKGGQ
ncbi:MAG: ubiquitin-like protein Pup [Egibacteraceae bacterium]